MAWRATSVIRQCRPQAAACSVAPAAEEHRGAATCARVGRTVREPVLPVRSTCRPSIGQVMAMMPLALGAGKTVGGTPSIRVSHALAMRGFGVVGLVSMLCKALGLARLSLTLQRVLIGARLFCGVGGCRVFRRSCGIGSVFVRRRLVRRLGGCLEGQRKQAKGCGGRENLMHVWTPQTIGARPKRSKAKRVAC